MIDASTRHISIFYCSNQIIVKFILALSSIVQHSGNPPTLRQSNGCKCTCSEFCSVYAMFSNGLFLSVFPNMCTIHNFTAFLCQFYVDNITSCIVCKLYVAITHREFILQILLHAICPINRTYCPPRKIFALSFPHLAKFSPFQKKQAVSSAARRPVGGLVHYSRASASRLASVRPGVV